MLPYVLLQSWPALTIGYDTERDWLYLDWRGPQNQETVRLGSEQMVYYLQAIGNCKILNDNTNVTQPWVQPGSKWLLENLVPRLQRAGLEYLAWVYAPTHESRRSVQTTLALAQTKMEMEDFPDLATAYNWLISKHCHCARAVRNWPLASEQLQLG